MANLNINGKILKPYKIFETPREIANKSAKDPKVLITDLDDTLVFTMYKEIELLLQHPKIDLLKEVFILDDCSIERIYHRPEYLFQDWAVKPEYKDTEKHLEAKEIVKDTFSTPNFYKDVKPTKFAYAVKDYLNTDLCEKVYIESHCLSDYAIEQKIDWTREFYKDNLNKIEFIATDNANKSEPIVDKNIKWDIFADDRLDCIYDMVVYGQGLGNEILIPKFGYNQPTQRLSKLVEDFNIQLFYLDVL